MAELFCGNENLSVSLSLRKQPTFHNATKGFPVKWRLRNEHRNSVLMMHRYPDLGSASDWLKQILPAVWPIRSTTEILAMTCHQYGTSAFVSQTSFHGWQRGGKVWGLISENPEARGIIRQVPSVVVVWIFFGTTQYYDLQLQCGISKCFIWWMPVHMVAEVYTCRNQIYKTSCPSLIVA